MNTELVRQKVTESAAVRAYMAAQGYAIDTAWSVDSAQLRN